jgi:nucleotide-binding universal stress UspA family protein
MFENILVAVDGSKHSDRAFDVAAHVARTYGSRLIVLHVFQGSTGSGTIVSEVAEGANTLAGREIIESYEKRLEGKKIAGARFLLQKGDAADRILKTADSENVDLVVIGSRGRGGVEALLLGSVSQKVLNNVKCQVLVTKR